MTHPIPNSALDDRLAFVGTSGSGKTYAAGTAVERLLATGARVVIVDPLDVWHGLRLTADGKSASPYNVVIFGGEHGDLPLTEHAGKLIGETVATMAESCIVSLGGLPSKAAERRFMLAFLETLYRKTDPKKTGLYHLIFDEADLWAPQRSTEPMLQSKMEEIVRRGRVKGFIPWLITQRPAVISKDVLSQADGLIAMKLTSSQDRNAVGDWVKGQADEGQWKTIYNDLATMPRGTGIVWLPAHGHLATAQFPAKKTFDSSRTPSRGEKRVAISLKPIDLGSLRTKLSSIEEETKANDPAALKAEIAKLRKELAAKPVPAPAVDPKALAEAEHNGFRHGKAVGKSMGYVDGYNACRQDVVDALPIVMKESPEEYREDMAVISGVPRVPKSAARAVSAPKAAPVVNHQPSGAPSKLPPGERAVLIAAVQYGGVDRDQLSVLTGYKRSSRDAYIARLREKGLVEVSGPTIAPTDAARDALGDDYQPLPTGHALQEYWMARLPEGEKRVLACVIDCYPNEVERTAIDQATGYKRSSRDAYIARLKSRRLVTTDSGGVTAASTLF